MSFGGKPRTKAQQARFDAIKAGPCLACLSLDRPSEGMGIVEVHHLLSGGRRRGHDYTAGLCMWHHRAVPQWGCTHAEMREHYGPSLAEGSKRFHEAFGSDEELLLMQNRLLGISEAA